MGKIQTILLATVVLLGTVGAGSASADRPRSVLTLTAGKSTVHLMCQPDGGSHPDAKSACRAIKSARGDFDNLPDSPTFAACTMEYRPVTASARGYWHGHRVHWKHKYANPCTLRADTGVVFDFQRVRHV
jgi:subtilisin inhibitor-like